MSRKIPAFRGLYGKIRKQKDLAAVRELTAAGEASARDFKDRETETAPAWGAAGWTVSRTIVAVLVNRTGG